MVGLINIQCFSYTYQTENCPWNTIYAVFFITVQCTAAQQQNYQSLNNENMYLSPIFKDLHQERIGWGLRAKWVILRFLLTLMKTLPVLRIDLFLLENKWENF